MYGLTVGLPSLPTEPTVARSSSCSCDYGAEHTVRGPVHTMKRVGWLPEVFSAGAGEGGGPAMYSARLHSTPGRQVKQL